MSLIFAVALAAVQAQAADPAPPPEAMIDFLGRRRLCLALPSLEARDAFQQAESRRLACDALPSEERRWRQTARGDPAALGWLDSDPRDFRLPAIIVSSAAGPPGAYVHRLLWTGTDNGGVVPFRLEVDSDVDNGATTVITASFGDVPARAFRLDNAHFAWLDLQGVRVALDAGGAALRIDIRYGFRRGYCGDRDSDDRPSLSLVFARGGVAATDQDRANCGMTRRPLSPAAPDRPTPR